MPIVQKLRSSFSDDTINDTDYHKLVSDFPIQIDILKYLHKIGRGQIILRVVSQRAFLFEPLKGRVLLKTLRIFECDSAEMGNVVTEFEKIICFGLESSENKYEQILLAELAKSALIYMAGRQLYNGGDDRLKCCISNPALCLYYLNHPNRHLRFWKIRSAIEQTKNLNDSDKNQMLTCLNNIQR